MKTTKNTFEDFPDWLLEKWQNIADLLAESIDIPAALIMKTENEFMEVFISSHSENNPYQEGAKEKWYGLYCETVIKTQNKLLVPNATTDKIWNNNPDLKRGMIAYLGFPLNFPDNQPFGTLCVLDNKERPFTLLNEKLILQFKNVIELDLALLQSFELKTSHLAASVVQESAERKQAEQALKLVQSSLDSASDALFWMTPDGKIVNVNLAACHLLGYTRKELLHLTVPEVDVHYNAEIWEQHFRELRKLGTLKFETKQLTKDRRLIPVEIVANYLCFGDEEYNCAFVRDISERKQAEEDSYKQREILQSVFDHIPVMISYYNESGKFEMMNREMVEKLGWNFEDWENEGILARCYPDPEAYKEVLDFMVNKPAGWKEFKTTTKYGTEIITSWTNVTLSNGVSIGFGQDITYRKQAEETIIESEERFRNIFENSMVGKSLTYLDGRIKTNRAFCEIVGYSEEELSKLKWQTITHPDDVSRDEGIVKSIRSGKKFSERWEKRYIKKNGDLVWVDISTKLQRDHQDKPLYFLTSIIDITERKRVEEAMEDSEQRFRNVLQDVKNVSVQGYAPDGTTTYWNKASELLYGYTAQEAIGRNLLDLIIPAEMKDDVSGAIKWMAETGQPIPSSELVLQRKDGSSVSVFSHHTIVQISGKPQELFCIDIDLTDRKQADEALRDNNSRLELAMQSANMAWWEMDIATGNVIFDKRKSEMLGYPSEKFKHYKDFMALVHPEDSDKAMKVMQKNIDGESDKYEVEYRILTQSGGYKWFYDIGAVLKRDLNGIPINVTGLVLDITEQKLAEEKLKESESRYRNLFDQANEGLILLTMDGKIAELNQSFARMHGYTVDEMMDMDITDLDVLREDAFDGREEIMRRILSGEVVRFEVEHYHKDGHSFVMSDTVSVITIAGQKYFLAFHQDITERKLSESILKDIIEKNPISIQILDLEGYVIQTNSAFTKLFGVQPPNDYSIFKDTQLLKQGLGELFEQVKKGEVVYFPDSFYNVHDVDPSFPDSPVWIKAIGFTLNKNDGKPDRVVLMHENITERRNAEALLNDIIDKNPMSIQIVDKAGLTIHANPAYLQLFGSLPPANYSIFADLESKSPELKALISQVKNGEIVHLPDIYFNAHDAVSEAPDIPLWIRALIFPLKDSGGKSERFVFMHENITERKRAEEELRNSENNYKTLFNENTDGITIFSISEDESAIVILDMNECAASMLGYSLEEMIKMDPKKLEIDVTREKIEKRIEELKTKGYLNYETILQHKNGNKVNVEIKTVVISYANQPAVMNIARDISNRKQIEQELIVAKENAEENEKKYRQIFDNTFDIMSLYEVTEDGRYKVITFNAAEEKLIGKVENYQNRYIDECIPPELYNQFKQHYDRCIKAEKLIEYEEDISFKNINKTFYTQLIPLKNSEGRIHRIIVISRDITDVKLLSTQLKHQNEELKLLNIDLTVSKEEAEKSELKALTYIDSAPDGICVVDGKGVYLRVNKEFTKLFGYTSDEMLHGFEIPLVAKEDYQKARNYSEKLVRNGKCSGEFLFVKKDGSVFNGLMSSVKVFDDQYLSFIKNISVLKKTEKELVHAKQKAEESDKLKTAFLSNMAHEIRTPMNGILGFSDLLQEPGLSDERQQEYIKIIKKSGKRMLNIINEIVEISKIEAGLMQIDINETDINEKIEFTYAFFKPEAEARSLKLSIGNTLPQKKAIIKSDGQKIYSILINLVKNAIKYTDNGSIEFGYDVVETGNDLFLQFYVKDTGIGIPKDRQEAIFERFIQADIFDKMARQGAGLGLSIAKAYVEMLGGKIRVESEEGIGSTFYFTLPYTFEPEEKNVVENDWASDIADNVAENLKILIVEDDETSEMLLGIAVEMYSNEIFRARTGIEAVEICRINPDIDLILMDIQMPDLNGYEATRQIRQFNKDVVIIAQTAFGLLGDREKSIASGCNDYIAKPFNRTELLALIQKYFIK